MQNDSIGLVNTKNGISRPVRVSNDIDRQFARPHVAHNRLDRIDARALVVVRVHSRSTGTVLNSESTVDIGDDVSDRSTLRVESNPLDPGGLSEHTCSSNGRVQSNGFLNLLASKSGHTVVSVTSHHSNQPSVCTLCNVIGRHDAHALLNLGKAEV